MGPSRIDGHLPFVHSHFWNHAFSRRQFLGASAVSVGTLAAGGLWKPLLAFAGDRIATVAPRPIPGGITVPFSPPVFIHHFPPVTNIPLASINDPSTISDFNGFVGVCRVKGQGTGTDTTTGNQTTLHYQVDNGFMDGVYVGVDGKHHRGTFAFV
jgi:hypothetical protein